MILSLAYQNSVVFPNNKKYECIDLLSSGVENVSLDKYPNLQRIRISKCHKLRTVTLSNMPKLQVVDLLDNKDLQLVTFNNCPSLITVDAGFNLNLTKLRGISNIKYLSIPYSYQILLENLKNIVYLDLTGMTDINYHKIFQNCPNLECFIFSVGATLNLSEITHNHSLKIIQISSVQLNCDSVDPNTNLKIIIFDGCKDYKQCIIGNVELLDQFYVTDCFKSNKKGQENICEFIDFVPKYQSLQRLLYGPWGVPEVDKKDSVEVQHPIVESPEGINRERAVDAILGSLMASAVFDMIGVGVEFINDCMSKPLLLGHPNITWSHPRCNRHNKRFVRGTPTDDTSQSILIMRTIVDSNTNKTSNVFSFKNVKIDPVDFGLKLIEWIKKGHPEHKHQGGLGCGATTHAVVSHEKFKVDPISASYDVWVKKGKKIAPNGSVMRIAPCGVFAFWDDEIVIKHSETYAKVTHADPRCIYSSVASGLLIARYIQWNAGLLGEKEPNIDEVLEMAKNVVPDIEDYKDEVNFYSNCTSLVELNLSEEGKIGYCLKAFGSAIWALRYCKSIEEGIEKVLREGGDADTNGAVVGALLGAKYGFKNTPKEFIEFMFVGQWMFREITPFMKLMGLEIPPFPYI